MYKVGQMARNDYHLPIVFSDRDLESGRERIKALVRDERVRVPLNRNLTPPQTFI